jgi:phosphatidylinositol 4-kinase B
MQASLRDFSSTNHDPESLLMCQRTLLVCHELIFGDIPPPMPSAYPGFSWPSLPQFFRKKVKPRPHPALIGMSMVLAGSPGLPALSKVMGEVAIEQGRIDRQGSDVKSLERNEDDLFQGKALPSYESPVEEDEVDTPPEDVEDAQIPDHSFAPHERAKVESSVAGRRRRHEIMRAVRTSPSLSLRKDEQPPRFSDDPLGQLDPVTPAVTQSVPSLHSIEQSHQRNISTFSDTLLNRYDFGSQIHLLRSHFCRSEVCFDFFFF